MGMKLEKINALVDTPQKPTPGQGTPSAQQIKAVVQAAQSSAADPKKSAEPRMVQNSRGGTPRRFVRGEE